MESCHVEGTIEGAIEVVTGLARAAVQDSADPVACKVVVTVPVTVATGILTHRGPVRSLTTVQRPILDTRLVG